MRKKTESYVGIQNEIHGGMTEIGRIIRDAWVFGIIPETETCEGWLLSGIQSLVEKVNTRWEEYGCMVSRLPDDLRERHMRIHDEAIARARKEGWEPEMYSE
ncbi:MAG: hypothetical protein FD165_2064 [Gammaproteobacteria bacterium]|nr:MAG: hypothetical protein FD165_2064 [Gammaproteobacteria bacterium]TND01475.1 MAG: hypothetical protein FD120_2648 [Gammaproteobacteria bacterium]